MSESRKLYPSDVSNDEWALVAPYLTLLPESAGQRSYPLREGLQRAALQCEDRRTMAMDA